MSAQIGPHESQANLETARELAQRAVIRSRVELGRQGAALVVSDFLNGL